MKSLTFAALLVALALPASADAITVGVRDGTLGVIAAPGETNDVGVQQDGSDYIVEDNGQATTLGPGCAPELINNLVHGARCSGANKIVVSLGDRDDNLRPIGPLAAPVDYSGGPGTDLVIYVGDPVVPLTLSTDGIANDGRDGRDNIGPDVEHLFGRGLADTLTLGPAGGTITGFDGNDTLRGGPGNDLIEAAQVEDVGLNSGDFYPQGKDTVTCGAGKDTVYADGHDTVDSSSCEVIVTEGGGEEEGDTPYVVHGSSHGDSIGPLEYGWGPATVFAGRGNDTIRTAWVANVVAGTGSDRIIGFDGVAQHFYGDEGNDRIDVVDKKPAKFNRDLVHCGPGRDLVYANKNDRVARDCERVKRR
jgi:hypothetical protein